MATHGHGEGDEGGGLISVRARDGSGDGAGMHRNTTSAKNAITRTPIIDSAIIAVPYYHSWIAWVFSSDLKGLFRDGESVLEDPLIRDQLVRFAIEEHALELGNRRADVPALSSDYPFSLQLSKKLRASEFSRRLRQFSVQAQGGHGSLYVGDPDAVAGGLWQRAYFNNFASTIGGGTSQIQANIIAEHVLGLPK